MRRLVAVVFLTVSIACSAAVAQAPDLSKLDLVMRSVPDGPVVKVNGVNVSREEFAALYGAELTTYAMRTRQQPDDAVRLQTGLQCVNLLVQREILRQEALKRKLTVSEQEIRKSWQAQIDQLKKEMFKDRTGEISEAEILQKAGADKQRALAELRETLLIEKMRAELAKEKGVTVSDAEVQAIYDQNKDQMKRPEGVHLLRIYVNTRGTDQKKKAAALEKIQTAYARIKAGENFQNVAKATTDAPDKEKGGDPGIVSLAALPKSYTNKIIAMKPGDISDIFEDELGYHIIRLVEIIKASDAEPEKVKPMIRARLMEQKLETVVETFCQPFIAQPGYVHVYLQLDKVLAAHPQAEQLRKAVLGDAPAAPAPAAKASEKKPAPKAKK